MHEQRNIIVDGVASVEIPDSHFVLYQPNRIASENEDDNHE